MGLSNDTTLNTNYIKSPTEVDAYDNDLYDVKGYNRKVCRYAKKHKISGAEAFNRLYKNKKL